jgi:serine/threonine protein kinase
VLYGKRGEVKIIDYGLAWIRGEPKDRVQGTPEYMAPETARSRVINERTDIYNLGATMYRLTTMKLPPSALPGTESLRLNSKAYSSMLTPVQELNKAVPQSLCDLIHKCLAYDADKRPERVGEVLEVLQQIATDQGTPISHDE